MGKIDYMDYILKFAKGEDLTGFYTSDSGGINCKRIGQDDFSGLYRVWNNGRGRLKVADFNENKLYLNACLLSNSDKKYLFEQLTKLKIKFCFVNYGYPAYYNESIFAQKEINIFKK